ncbi:hypothetical protein IW510_18670 [Enterococcus sp. BWR-S5]|nr:hypothetical protein [Enterococcus sp. BWR-S5]
MDYQEFLAKLSRPAQRALLHEKVNSFEKLSSLTEKQVLSFHGIGPSSLPVMKDCLRAVGLTFAA